MFFESRAIQSESTSFCEVVPPTKYTIKELKREFGTEEKCLTYIFKARYGDVEICPHCGKPFSYSKVSGRKKYKCAYCGGELAPLADTIFHKSSTSLVLWFHAIYLFSVSKNGVSAKELERQLGVTYKTAWRMANQIRKLFAEEIEQPFENTVEVDETYVGGSRRGKRGRGAEGKAPVIGIVERQGKVKAKVSLDTKADTILPMIEETVKPEGRVITDDYRSYNRVSLHGFKHDKIKHSTKRYVDGDIHTNTIEGFWGQLKRGLNGTYHSVSTKYLQHYVNEFSFRYNHRSAGALFPRLVPVAAQMMDTP